MYIQTEQTPNPNTLKFIPGERVMESGTISFRSKEEALENSPLAVILFEIPGVEQVFLGLDFITVSKSEDLQWENLKPHVLTTIMEHYISGRPVINQQQGGSSQANASDTSSEEDDEIVKQIKELLDTRVRPAVADDGGDIIYHDFRDGVVYLEMHGSCSGCPSSTVTLKNGIENMLKHYVPEVEAVESTNALPPDAFDL